MSYYREMVKDMDDSQKLELVSILIESVKPIQTRMLPDSCMVRRQKTTKTTN